MARAQLETSMVCLLAEWPYTRLNIMCNNQLTVKYNDKDGSMSDL